MPDLLGATLGPYQILEQIGLGGMATVYKAYQPGMNRLVALKVLPEHYARDPRFVKRFEREAQVVAKLEHRNIIPIYDYGSHDNITYLAMRYLQAGTVKDILAHGALPLNDVAKLLSDISSALDYAHSQGIIHRDVKPSNVLVDKQGNAYLTDFGIAKVLEGTADFTGSSVLGTPTYMAPEQTLGKPATAQSDIYSLGVMLYEMVVGKPPFEADTPMAIALMHVHEPLPLPRKIKEEIPEAVELVILKALAKDPKDRFQTANDLARAFASALGEESLVAPSRLIELASGAAEGKGSEEVTYDIREEVKRKERTEQRKKLMRLVPVGAAIVAFIGLIALSIWFATQVQESQIASQRAATAVVFAAETATESVSRLMATPNFSTAAARVQEATRTQAAIDTVMQSFRLTYAKGTQSVEETIIALTPTKTPTLTRTPTNTPTPLPTATPDKGLYNPENKHWYLLIRQGMSWHSSRDYCSLLGAHLVTIQNASENQFVYKIMPQGWLGATDEIKDGQWVWVTGEPWSYSNWAPHEPTNCGGSNCSPENYLQISRLDDTNQWNDVSGGTSPFVCEWDN